MSGESLEGLSDPFVVDLESYDAASDFYATIQENLRKYGEEFSTLAQALWGKQVANFLDSGPGHRDMDTSWEAARGLGKGGFGIVGLWQKVDEDGQIMDEMAIKEAVPGGSDARIPGKPTLAKEAAIMKQLNDAEEAGPWQVKNILRLRSFKHFPSSGRWRFYLEFAEWGDLFKLIYTYKLWDSYLPEELLWHVFNGLAQATYIMHSSQFTHADLGSELDTEVVHFDIKPANIYMARSSEQSQLRNYPTIKLADFGLSEMTGAWDLNNPAYYEHKGTDGYKPPEQTGFTLYWNRRPDATPTSLVPRQFREAQFLSKHNVWAVGKLIYDMMTMSNADDLGYEMKAETKEHNYYDQLEEHAIRVIETKKSPEYSQRLRDLVRSCLHLAMERRPDPSELLNKTREAVRAAAQNWAEKGEGQRLYYMGNEINHMKRGSAGIEMNRGDLNTIREGLWGDPNWEPLLSGRWATEVIQGTFVDQPILEGGPKVPFPPLLASVQQHPRVGHRGRGVKWKLHPLHRPEGRQGQNEGQGSQGRTDDTAYRERAQQQARGQEISEGRVRQENQGEEAPNQTAREENRSRENVYQTVQEQNQGLETTDPNQHEDQGPTNSQHPNNNQNNESSLARATAWLAKAAAEMPQPRLNLEAPRRPVRVGLNPPAIPDPQPAPQQPQAGKKRRRMMGLSLNDDGLQEIDGRNVNGRMLRKRRG